MTVFFTSDTHFGDHRVIRIDRRPFASPAQMDEDLVRRWNEVVCAEDEVWHLGDFAVRQSPERIAALLGRLNGRKHLIAGNNDPPVTREQPAWASVALFAEIDLDGQGLVLCHYALRTWNGMGKGVVDLHGHSHGRLKPMTRQFDVGVDVWDYRPVSLETILASRRRRMRAGQPAGE